MVTDMPFSNDVWPLITIAERITKDPSFRALNPSYHHTKWPASMITVAMYSILTDVEVQVFYKYIGGIIAGVSLMIILYVLGSRLFNSRVGGLVFSIIPLFFPSTLIYTSVFLKETYAQIITTTLALLIAMTRLGRNRDLALTGLLWTTLLISHPLPSLILLASIIACIALHVVSGYVGSPLVSRRLILTVLLMAAWWSIYNILFAGGVLWPISIKDALFLLVYAAGVYSGFIILGRLSLYVFSLLGLFVGIAISYSMTASLNWLYLVFFYVMPVTAIILVVSKGVGDNRAESKPGIIAPITLVVYTAFLYISTYLIEILSVIHRVLNYFVYPLAMYSTRLTRRKLGVFAPVLLIAFSLIYMFTVSMGLDPMLFYWRFTRVDEVLVEYLHLHIGSPAVTIYGDSKYSYLVQGVITEPSPLALVNPCNINTSLVLSSENLRYGFPLSPIDYIKLESNVLYCRGLLLNMDNQVFLTG